MLKLEKPVSVDLTSQYITSVDEIPHYIFAKIACDILDSGQRYDKKLSILKQDYQHGNPFDVQEGFHFTLDTRKILDFSLRLHQTKSRNSTKQSLFKATKKVKDWLIYYSRDQLLAQSELRAFIRQVIQDSINSAYHTSLHDFGVKPLTGNVLKDYISVHALITSLRADTCDAYITRFRYIFFGEVDDDLQRDIVNRLMLSSSENTFYGTQPIMRVLLGIPEIAKRMITNRQEYASFLHSLANNYQSDALSDYVGEHDAYKQIAQNSYPIAVRYTLTRDVPAVLSEIRSRRLLSNGWLGVLANQRGRQRLSLRNVTFSFSYMTVLRYLSKQGYDRDDNASLFVIQKLGGRIKITDRNALWLTIQAKKSVLDAYNRLAKPVTDLVTTRSVYDLKKTIQEMQSSGFTYTVPDNLLVAYVDSVDDVKFVESQRLVIAFDKKYYYTLKKEIADLEYIIAMTIN